MKKTVYFLAILFSLNSFNQVSAHGIHIDYSFKHPSVSLKIYYSKTSPVVNADVSVFSPGSEELFVSGKTDKDGHFEFDPDIPGEWTVKVDDGMGHHKTLVISIEDFSDHVVSGHDHDNGHFHIPLVYKIIFGLSVIFGITGVWYGLKARKK